LSSRITEALQQALQASQPELEAEAQDQKTIASDREGWTSDPEMTVHEKVLGWSTADPADHDGLSQWEGRNEDDAGGERPQTPALDINNTPDQQDGAEGEEPGDSSDNLKPTLPEVDMARINFVINTSSFSWLLKAVQSRSQLDYAAADILDSIRTAASSCLNEYRGNRALRSQKAVMRMAWDPRAFLEQQGYERINALRTAITINGSAAEAQLLSCESYVKQTWPLTGETVLEALTAATDVDPATPVTRTMFDGLQLSLQLEDGSVRVECSGLFDSIVEVAEVLSWIGAALRESSVPGKITHSIASLRFDEKATYKDSSVQLLLSFTEEELPSTSAASLEGSCWLHGFLNNPVIAKGFPVTHRPNAMMGLEMPLEVMALLVDAPQLTVFNNRALLKGFNAAVFPTAYAENLIKWHFILNEDGERLRYGDKRTMESPQVAPSEATSRIREARHILGWATAAAYNIGECSLSQFHIPMPRA